MTDQSPQSPDGVGDPLVPPPSFEPARADEDDYDDEYDEDDDDAGDAPEPEARGAGGVLRGAITGVIAAGAGLAAGELVSVFTGEAASPVVAVGQWAISHTPTSLEQFAIRNFGNHDKRALLIGVYTVLALFSTAVGILARRYLTAASYVAALFGLVGMVAAATHANAGSGALFPSLLAGLVTVTVLRWLTILAAQDTDPEGGPSERRRFLLGAFGTDRKSVV